MSIIFLIGMPGAGKSHWGRLWGNAYGYDISDLDEKVEAQAGVSITDIFSGVGEKEFRKLEAAVLLNTISAARERNTIIITGGGTPTFDGNMDIMLRTGLVVYLKSGLNGLLSNILAGGNSRPLLQDCKLGMLDDMLAERKPFYERAHLIFEVEKISTDTFAEILKACSGLPS